MREYIQRLDIENFRENPNEEPEELCNPKEIPNPNLKVFYDTVVKKGLSENPEE